MTRSVQRQSLPYSPVSPRDGRSPSISSKASKSSDNGCLSISTSAELEASVENLEAHAGAAARTRRSGGGDDRSRRVTSTSPLTSQNCSMPPLSPQHSACSGSRVPTRLTASTSEASEDVGYSLFFETYLPPPQATSLPRILSASLSSVDKGLSSYSRRSELSQRQETHAETAVSTQSLASYYLPMRLTTLSDDYCAYTPETSGIPLDYGLSTYVMTPPLAPTGQPVVRSATATSPTKRSWLRSAETPSPQMRALTSPPSSSEPMAAQSRVAVESSVTRVASPTSPSSHSYSTTDAPSPFITPTPAAALPATSSLAVDTVAMERAPPEPIVNQVMGIPCHAAPVPPAAAAGCVAESTIRTASSPSSPPKTSSSRMTRPSPHAGQRRASAAVCIAEVPVARTAPLRTAQAIPEDLSRSKPMTPARAASSPACHSATPKQQPSPPADTWPPVRLGPGRRLSGPQEKSEDQRAPLVTAPKGILRNSRHVSSIPLSGVDLRQASDETGNIGRRVNAPERVESRGFAATTQTDAPDREEGVDTSRPSTLTLDPPAEPLRTILGGPSPTAASPAAAARPGSGSPMKKRGSWMPPPLDPFRPRVIFLIPPPVLPPTHEEQLAKCPRRTPRALVEPPNLFREEGARDGDGKGA